MIYLVYLLMVPISLVLTLLAVILAPILPLFKQNIYGWCNNHSYQAFGPRLPSWLNWFMTPDNSLDGDASFQQLFPPGSYWSQVHWLWRNPAYSFGLRYLTAPYFTTVSGDKTIKDNDNAKAGWCLVHANGLFQFVYIKRIFSTSRCIYVNLGWNIRALVDDNVNPKPDPYQATFVFSPRISGFR
jgi:hypothetical protein